MGYLEQNWERPDQGIWEIRGRRAALHALAGDDLGGARLRRAGGAGLRR